MFRRSPSPRPPPIFFVLAGGRRDSILLQPLPVGLGDGRTVPAPEHRAPVSRQPAVCSTPTRPARCSSAGELRPRRADSAKKEWVSNLVSPLNLVVVHRVNTDDPAKRSPWTKLVGFCI